MKARLQPRPAVGATTPWSFPAFRRGRLANGLRTLVCHLPGRVVVQVRLLLPAGIGIEDTARAGVAATTAAALYEGTGTRSADELSVALESYAATSTAGAEWQGLHIAGSVPAVDLAPVLGLLTELVGEPAFRDAELERLQRRLLENLAIQRFQPRYRSAAAFDRAAFPGGSRLALPGQGTPTTVAATTADDIRRHWSLAAQPAQATVVIAGDLRGVDLDQVLDDTLGTWVPDGAAPAPVPVPEATASPSGRSLGVVDFPGAVQTHLVLGAVSGRPSIEDRLALSAAAHYLGGFIGSRLSRRIREQLAASYGASASVEYRLDHTVLRMQSSVETGATAAAAQVMHEEAAALQSGSIDLETMQATLANLRRAAAMAFAQPGTVVNELVALVREGLPDEYLERRHEELSALTPEAVAGAFHRHTDPAGLCGAAAGAAASIAGPLEALGYEVGVEPAI